MVFYATATQICDLVKGGLSSLVMLIHSSIVVTKRADRLHRHGRLHDRDIQHACCRCHESTG